MGTQDTHAALNDALKAHILAVRADAREKALAEALAGMPALTTVRDAHEGLTPILDALKDAGPDAADMFKAASLVADVLANVGKALASKPAERPAAPAAPANPFAKRPAQDPPQTARVESTTPPHASDASNQAYLDAIAEYLGKFSHRQRIEHLREYADAVRTGMTPPAPDKALAERWTDRLAQYAKIDKIAARFA